MIDPRSLIRRLAALAAALLLLPGAASGQTDTGAADFSRYVAMGDSLTAAFSSGGLIAEVQRNSYPALLFNQVFPATAQQAPGTFEQPLVSPPGIPPLLDLVSLQPLLIAPRAPQSQAGMPSNLTLPRPYNNLAVPGFKVGDVLETVTGNPVIDLVLRGLGTQLQQALALEPTFVSLWIGNNDVLGAATSGIVIDGVTLTPVAAFEADYRAIVAAVRGAGAEMALVTIPDVTAIPFVTTLPPVVVDPITREPVLVGGQPVPLIGPEGPLGADDFVLLTASEPLAQGIGVPAALGGTGQPLGTEFVLSAEEATAISARVNALNGVIRAVADEAGAAVLDVFTIFNEIAADGVSVGGIDYSADFLTGGVVSYDGVHATPFGYAFLANELVKAINERFGAAIPQVDLFPFTFGPPAAGGTLTAAEAKGAVFTAAAYETLRRGLRTPRTGWLLRQLERGNGPGGPGPGPGGGTGPAPAAPQRPDLPRPPRDGRPAG